MIINLKKTYNNARQVTSSLSGSGRKSPQFKGRSVPPPSCDRCMPYNTAFLNLNVSIIKLNIMKKTFFVIGLYLLFNLSCKKGVNTNPTYGLYTESSPVSGRSQLNFISSNLVVKTELGSNYKDSFYYSYTTGKILLTPAWTTIYSATSFDFNRIDNNTFQIENLYPSIPEDPKTYMIFKK